MHPDLVESQPLVGPLGNLMSRSPEGRSEYPCCFVAEPAGLSLERLVVAMGPTIGLGDEVLAARALVERAQAVTGVSIHVSTHNFDLWKCLQGPVSPLPAPPLGAFHYLDSLSPAERKRTGFVFVDFLITDVSPDPYFGPPGIAYGGRWSMGAADCDFLDLTRNLRHRSRYPDGLPASRWLEARWMAGRVLHGNPAAERGLEPRSAGPRGPRRRVVLQALTAKPRLTFPNEFYCDIFSRVVRAVPDFELQMIPNPTQQGQALVLELMDSLADVVPSVAIPAPEVNSLSGVFQRLAQSDLLFGPDTLTSHLAALMGLPQVTISLPEHQAWRTIESPCLSVVADRPKEELIDACARGIVAFLKIDDLRDEARIASGSRDWRESIERVEHMVAHYLHSGSFHQPPGAAELIGHIQQLYGQIAPEIGRWTGNEAAQAPLASLDLSVFDHFEDRARALVRWYRAVQLTETAAILGAL